MKVIRFSLFTALALMVLGAVAAEAATVTAVQISDAATSPDTGDLGDASISIGDLTISADPRNLGWEPSTTDVGESIGVSGGGRDGRTGNGGAETLTLDFTGGVGAEISQIVLGRFGGNDLDATIKGFSSDPGATINVTSGTGSPSVSFAGDTLTILPSGFVFEYEVNLANAVTVSSLDINSSGNNNGSGGIAFQAINFTTVIPEPSSLVTCLLLAFLGAVGTLRHTDR